MRYCLKNAYGNRITSAAKASLWWLIPSSQKVFGLFYICIHSQAVSRVHLSSPFPFWWDTYSLDLTVNLVQRNKTASAGCPPRLFYYAPRFFFVMTTHSVASAAVIAAIVLTISAVFFLSISIQQTPRRVLSSGGIGMRSFPAFTSWYVQISIPDDECKPDQRNV